MDFGGCEPSWVGSDIAEGVVLVSAVTAAFLDAGEGSTHRERERD